MFDTAACTFLVGFLSCPEDTVLQYIWLPIQLTEVGSPDDPGKEEWRVCVGVVNDVVAAVSRTFLSQQVGIQATIGTLLVLEIDFGQKERLFIKCRTNRCWSP
jgi:hypothetical protein